MRTLRRKKNLTQHELGELVGGVPYQSIQNIESGKVLNPRYILELARVLGVSTDYLLKGIEVDDQEQLPLSDNTTLIAINNSIDDLDERRFYIISTDKDKTLALSGDIRIEGEVVDIFTSQKNKFF